MKTQQLVIFMLCLFLLIPATSSYAAKKKLIYSDETYKVYQQGKLSWVEIRLKDEREHRGEPVYYIPRKNYTVWEKVVITKKGFFSADIFYSNLPPPFSLLLPMDMIYINMIIHYPEKSAFIVRLNHADPIYFIRILLDKVKNV